MKIIKKWRMKNKLFTANQTTMRKIGVQPSKISCIKEDKIIEKIIVKSKAAHR